MLEGVSRATPRATCLVCFECTFCVSCVNEVLHNVCSNCGGGLCPRPLRPSKNWKGDNFLAVKPATHQVTHKPVDRETHSRFLATLVGNPVFEAGGTVEIRELPKT